jgi:hypothetical protein
MDRPRRPAMKNLILFCFRILQKLATRAKASGGPLLTNLHAQLTRPFGLKNSASFCPFWARSSPRGFLGDEPRSLLREGLFQQFARPEH